MSTPNPVTAAAQWFATAARHERAGPPVPLLRERFGLSAVEACEAIRRANLIKARAL